MMYDHNPLAYLNETLKDVSSPGVRFLKETYDCS